MRASAIASQFVKQKEQQPPKGECILVMTYDEFQNHPVYVRFRKECLANGDGIDKLLDDIKRNKYATSDAVKYVEARCNAILGNSERDKHLLLELTNSQSEFIKQTAEVLLATEHGIGKECFNNLLKEDECNLLISSVSQLLQINESAFVSRDPRLYYLLKNILKELSILVQFLPTEVQAKIAPQLTTVLENDLFKSS